MADIIALVGVVLALAVIIGVGLWTMADEDEEWLGTWEDEAARRMRRGGNG